MYSAACAFAHYTLSPLIAEHRRRGNATLADQIHAMSVTDLHQAGGLSSTTRQFQEASESLLRGLNCHIVPNDLPANLVQLTKGESDDEESYV